MLVRPIREFPSLTFFGSLYGIGFSQLFPPAAFHPSEIEIVVRLLLFAGLGMGVGAILEALEGRRE